jgi:hypothetical protein
MTPTDVNISQTTGPDWGAIFSAQSGLRAHLDGAVESVIARPRDVFTAKLGATQSFLKSLNAGRIAIIGMSPAAISLPRVLDIVCVLATFSRLARLPEITSSGIRFARLRRPDGEAVRLPVMTMGHLSAMCGVELRHLDTILSILVEDGVVVRVGDVQMTGVILMPGYVNDDLVKGILA